MGMFRPSKRSNRNYAHHNSRNHRHQNQDPYRHIHVEDKIDRVKRIRTVSVSVPMEYPGMTERERRRMYEGLAMVADAFRDADKRCEALHG